jgi:hypothetical protein
MGLTMRALVFALLTCLAGCGGSGGGSSVIPEAQAVTVDSCPTGDATAQLQAIFDEAKGPVDVTLPACTFNVSTVQVSKPATITCASPAVGGTVIRYTADEGVVVDPNVVVSVAAGGWNKRGYWFSIEKCRIEPATQGGGKHDLVLRARPGFFISSSRIENNHFGGSGEQGLLMENQGNANGIFSTRIVGNFIEGGVKGVLLGDSVQFMDNVVPDRAGLSGRGTPGFDLSFVVGAAESNLIRNNITTSGGCILIRNGTGLGILNNWCETAGAPTDGSLGLINLALCSECTIRDNRVQTLGGDAQYALALDGSTLTVIDSNKFTSGTAGNIAITNGSSAKLVGLNRCGGLDCKITGAAGLIN